MNWSEKYRPKSIEDLILNNDIKNNIKKWIIEFIGKKKKFTNCLILHGPPGIGKTSLAHIILNTYDFDIIEFNSSDIRNQKKLKEKINQINGNVNILNFMCNKKKKIGIIIDELDGLNSEKGSLKELISIINNNKLVSSPFICTTNTINKKIDLLKKKSLYIKLSKPNRNSIKNLITKISDNENLSLSAKIKETILNNSQLDFRRTINIMEFLFSFKSNIPNDSQINILIENYQKKNIDYTIYEATEKILNNYSQDFSSIYEQDRSNIGYLLYENFPNYIIYNKKNNDKEKLKTIANIYDYFSIGDVFDKNIYINQHFILNNYNEFIKINSTSLFINSLKKLPYNKYNKINYSTMINKISLEYLNIKLVKKILEFKISDNYVYSSDYIYLMVKNNNKSIKPLIKKYNIDNKIMEKICKLSTFFDKDDLTKLKKIIKDYYND